MLPVNLCSHHPLFSLGRNLSNFLALFDAGYFDDSDNDEGLSGSDELPALNEDMHSGELDLDDYPAFDESSYTGELGFDSD